MNNIQTGINVVSIENIIPNRFQPRIVFEEEGINELAASIKEHGLIQPIVVRQFNDKYEIIAGERRFKASKLAGLTEVPVVIKNVTDNESAELALIENVQRRNLNAIELAKSYKNILDMGTLTQEQLALKMGKSQAAIANGLRLLNLSNNVQNALMNKEISERHARSLLSFKTEKEQQKMLDRITSERLTVRDTDLEIKKLLNPESIKPIVPTPTVAPVIATIPKVEAAPISEPIEELVSSVSAPKIETLDNIFPISKEPLPMAPTFELPKVEEIVSTSTVNLLDSEPVTTPVQPTVTTTETNPGVPDFLTNIEALLQKRETIDLETEETNIDFKPIKTDKPEEFPSFYNPLEETPTIEKPILPLEPIADLEPVDPIFELPTFSFDDDSNEPIVKEFKFPEAVVTAAVAAPVSTSSFQNAIETIRECIKTLKEGGFAVESEELDFENKYSVTIDIKK